ncbi:hypothetical protein JOQ06_018929, partial [Pogonophryne albipinna]
MMFPPPCFTVDIQEFYEVTLLNTQKSCDQKLEEVNHMADKWERSVSIQNSEPAHSVCPVEEGGQSSSEPNLNERGEISIHTSELALSSFTLFHLVTLNPETAEEEWSRGWTKNKRQRMNERQKDCWVVGGVVSPAAKPLWRRHPDPYKGPTCSNVCPLWLLPLATV